MRARPVTLLLTASLVAASVLAPPAQARSGTHQRVGHSRAVAAPRPAPKTVLTLRARHCNGCKIRLGQWRSVHRAPWISEERTIRHGRVQFTMLTRHTHGMIMSATGSWEADNTVPTGDTSFAVFRYGGERAGDRVSFRQARQKQEGSACWAGTDARRKTLKLAIREVTVRATSGEDTQGTIAWLPVQRRSWLPMRGIVDGVYRSEEATVCKEP